MTAMVKQKLLPAVLQQVLCPGVNCALLLNLEGEPLASAGQHTSTIPGIVANIFMSYERDGMNALGADSLVYLLVECEQGRVAVAKASAFIVCVCGTTQMPTGLLLKKAQLLAAHLEAPMSKISEASH
eukprot:gnl/Hemi2/11298_TR3910_c0_g1_i1.p1 gnl/Hemi2/11298_TR3910_c0_g1~~gnl/Hemi2/11298_TR3910_c0_g1_i1.p1  ORF type:complete len:128 (+),score=31.83 gnl/Hemi2/11298_TR3910_c0_g1_i1:65-448(+)